MSKLRLPGGQGIYTLVIGVGHPVRVEVGRRGCVDFAEGVYTYTGSALGKSTSLKARISRHLASGKKRMRWHIDYLLSSEDVSVRAVVYFETRFRGECQVAKGLGRLAEVPVRGFGSSDCGGGCASHLHYFPNLSLEETISRVINVYGRVFDDALATVFRVSEQDE